MRNDTNNAAIFLNLLEVRFDGLAAEIVLPFLRCFRKCLLLALVPVRKSIAMPVRVPVYAPLRYLCNVSVSS